MGSDPWGPSRESDKSLSLSADNVSRPFLHKIMLELFTYESTYDDDQREANRSV